jgi:hypothetical protein
MLMLAPYPIPMSEDHKPDIQSEKRRILECGGRVDNMRNGHGGPARVWFKDGVAPGLAMSRSIGDRLSKQIGVISTPGNMNS